MNGQAVRFPFLQRDPSLGAASLAPLLPLTLSTTQSVPVLGLLDSAATVNVLPYAVGEQLGAIWEQQTTPLRLTGNLAAIEARVLIVSGEVKPFAPVLLLSCAVGIRDSAEADHRLSPNAWVARERVYRPMSKSAVVLPP